MAAVGFFVHHARPAASGTVELSIAAAGHARLDMANARPASEHVARGKARERIVAIGKRPFGEARLDRGAGCTRLRIDFVRRHIRARHACGIGRQVARARRVFHIENGPIGLPQHDPDRFRPAGLQRDMAAVEARMRGDEIADARQEPETGVQRYRIRRSWVVADA